MVTLASIVIGTQEKKLEDTKIFLSYPQLVLEKSVFKVNCSGRIYKCIGIPRGTNILHKFGFLIMTCDNVYDIICKVAFSN